MSRSKGLAQVAAVELFYIFVFHSPRILGWDIAQINLFRGAIVDPRPLWPQAALAGMAFGMVAFFSVFIFMFKGRTATFAGLVNRLTSLIAGTTATLVFFFVFNGRFPKVQDWISLAFIFIAVGFLSAAEKKRVTELLAAHEIESK